MTSVRKSRSRSNATHIADEGIRRSGSSTRCIELGDHACGGGGHAILHVDREHFARLSHPCIITRGAGPHDHEPLCVGVIGLGVSQRTHTGNCRIARGKSEILVRKAPEQCRQLVRVGDIQHEIGTQEGSCRISHSYRLLKSAAKVIGCPCPVLQLPQLPPMRNPPMRIVPHPPGWSASAGKIRTSVILGFKST